MAATNVQTFPGDVEISSDLDVNGVVLQAGSDVPVRWTSQNETAFTQSDSTKYYKIATLGTLASNSNAGLLRISGTIGGFGTTECTLIDAYLGTRGSALKIGGTLTGNGTGSSSDVDFIVYKESDDSFALWLKLVRYYTFDFTILGARVAGHRTLAVLPCPITDTSATPSGVSQGSVVSNCSVAFTATGNVGIGTTNPVGVNGGRCLEGSSSTGFEYIATRDDTAAVADDFVGAYLFKNADTDGVEPHYAGMSAKMTGTNGPMDLRFHTNRDQYESDTPQMLIKSDGNVGIGTDDPSNALHIRNAIPAVLLDDTDDDTKVRLTGGTGGDLYLDSNYGGSGSTGDIIFREASSEKMRITGAGNVGIGTNAPLGLLHLSSGTSGDANLIIEADTDNNNEADNPKITFRQDGGFLEAEIGLSNNHMVFRSRSTANTNTGFIWYSNVSVSGGHSKTDLGDLQTDQVERMRLTGDGDVGIGTNNPAAPLHVYPAGQNPGTEYPLLNFSPSFGEGFLGISATATHTNAVGADLRFKGLIYAGASPAVVRDVMCLKPVGKVGIGTNNPAGNLHIWPGTDGGFMIGDLTTTQATAPICVRDQANEQIHFYYGTTKVGSITSTGSATAFNTSSDYRLKENLVELTSALDRVNELSVYRFNFIAEPNRTVDGFLAHELQSIIPEAVTGVKDETLEFGVLTRVDDGTIIQGDVIKPKILDEGTEWSVTSSKPNYQGIDQSKVVPLLTRSIQELSTQLTSVLARLDVLESA